MRNNFSGNNQDNHDSPAQSANSSVALPEGVNKRTAEIATIFAALSIESFIALVNSNPADTSLRRSFTTTDPVKLEKMRAAEAESQKKNKKFNFNASSIQSFEREMVKLSLAAGEEKISIAAAKLRFIMQNKSVAGAALHVAITKVIALELVGIAEFDPMVHEVGKRSGLNDEQLRRIMSQYFNATLNAGVELDPLTRGLQNPTLLVQEFHKDHAGKLVGREALVADGCQQLSGARSTTSGTNVASTIATTTTTLTTTTTSTTSAATSTAQVNVESGVIGQSSRVGLSNTSREPSYNI
ncbi:MAG: hypothetical protein JSS50_05080 [Proteobacteria bacterium]|nr:hypothetical protein [Pseudomonadota bacterium]